MGQLFTVGRHNGPNLRLKFVRETEWIALRDQSGKGETDALIEAQDVSPSTRRPDPLSRAGFIWQNERNMPC